MFSQERSKASFDIDSLSHFLYGGKGKFEEFQTKLATLANDSVMKFDPSFLSESRADMMTAYAKKTMKFHSHYPLDGSTELDKSNMFCFPTTFSLHGLMFLVTLKNLCD